jgi:transposase
MEHSVLKIPRPVRRRLKKLTQKPSEHSRRAHAILLLWDTDNCVASVARLLRAARSSVQRWRALYEDFGEHGLVPRQRGRSAWKANDDVLTALTDLLQSTPPERGYLRSRWSSELLALELLRLTGVEVHATTVRRWLKELNYGYRRARPTLCIRDPRKAERMQAIERALGDKAPYTEVFYSDEADVDLNPRIGPAWMLRGTQSAIPTPGTNQKRYLAGALNARSGKVIWAEGERKNSLLFIHLLYKIKRAYRRARRIVLIVDNFVIHKSHITRRWLANNPKFELLFQPVYHPWVNKIERLWKTLHDTVTRNHHHPTMKRLMGDVRRFMRVCQPWPGNDHALAYA